MDYKRPHMVRTMNMTDVMLFGEAAESKPALKNACLTDFIFCQEKDYRCNDKQMLQSNRTVRSRTFPFLLAFDSSALE